MIRKTFMFLTALTITFFSVYVSNVATYTVVANSIINFDENTSAENDSPNGSQPGGDQSDNEQPGGEQPGGGQPGETPQPGPWTVTFNTGGGLLNGNTQAVVISNIAHGTPWSSVSVPSKSPSTGQPQGTTSNNWDSSFPATVTSNLTFTAQWNLGTTTHQVTFNINGANATWQNGGSAPITVNTNASGNIPSQSVPTGLTRAGFTHNGWSATPTGTAVSNITQINITTPTTFYAVWTQAATNTITFNTSGGTRQGSTSNFTRNLSPNQTWQNTFGTSGADAFATWTAVTRSNFTFVEWRNATGTIFNQSTQMPSSNLTVYAIWRPTAGGNTRTLTFNPNGGNLRGSTNNVTMPVANNQSIQNSNGYRSFEMANLQPTRTGFTFEGWENAAGTLINIANTTFTQNTTLNARWGGGTQHTLTFNPQGGTWQGGGNTPLTRQIVSGQSVQSHHNVNLQTFVPTVTRQGYNFAGWYIGTSTNPFTVTTTVTQNLTINATWVPVLAIPPAPSPDQAQQPQQPQPPAPSPGPTFNDVASGAWYAHYVNTVVSRGIFQGTADNAFSPNVNMNRAMFAEVIFRLQQATNQSHTPAFTDVSSSAWYFNGVQWAFANDIVQGVGTGLFAPNSPITREQMAVMLYRYAQVFDINLPQGTVDFADNSQIAPWAQQAVGTMQASGLLTGRPGNLFDPQATATRAEVAAIFARLLQRM